MSALICFHVGPSHARPRSHERGVALVITLLLLLLLTAISVAMVLATSTDLLIGGYYRNQRGAFYAADSGVTIVRQEMTNLLLAQAPATFSTGTPPLPASAAANVQSALLSRYGGFTSLNQGPAADSWPLSFRVLNFSLAPVSSPPQPVVTTVDAAGNPTGYQYTYNYTVSAEGRSRVGEAARVDEVGTLIVNATVSPATPSQVSFANWGFFVDQQTVCDGSFLVPGTIGGPVHTNGGWTFGTTGAYIFTDPVSQSNSRFGFQFSHPSCGCRQSSSPPVSCRNQTINPTFQSGYTVAAPQVDLPDNDFSQKRAVLDGLGKDTSPVTPAEMSAKLKRADGTAYPPSGAAGVYLPYTVDPVTGAKVFRGGGIYVEGNASVVLTPVGTSGQRFTITQGTLTTTITIDPVTNTTTVSEGSINTVIQGVPMDLMSVPPRPATMLYVQGSITSLRGPAQGQPAIQDGAAISITASSNVRITGDLIYKTQPVTKTADDPCCPGTPPGTPIPGNHNGQVLGIFTATGDIQLDNQQPLAVLEINASLATISEGGTGGLVNVGARIETLNIVGGRIQNRIKNINAATRNVFYDRRFGTGFAPPWFPATTISAPGVFTATLNPTTQRLRWVHMNAQ
jgi:hypothetical protein